MKAKDLDTDKSKLQHKVRTVSDLIRHIKTREAESEASNYNLFFGAGCSVTSGIRPANKLIEEWALDLYERFNKKKPSKITIEEAKKYLESEQSSWYNKESAYSSLFQKAYEFPSQRRRFVEREVDKALPSIGYAYLTSLVTQKYFNTIFTTNFDDLINEAFYQFSNVRPLLCAHDSSIKSISITSKRPKIIKLHGDYLFDDIKSTLRETESLEQNTKEKLIEFCKEFGLIIVGYAGNDRSIMDVLDFLTKQDNYLKNGVYWCLREEDEINHTLQNLFWKEKVYPVIIDGYDELFAEIHTKLIGSGLDFEASIKNSKLQKIKKNILDEKNPINLNSFINNDIQKIKDNNNRQEISEFLSNLNNSGETDGLSSIQLRNLLEIEDLLNKNEHDKAYKVAEEFYYQAEDERDKSRYISMLINISNKKGDSRSSLGWCDSLIEIDPNNISYIIRKSQFITDLSEKYYYLDKTSKEYSYQYRLHNLAAQAGYDLLKHNPLESGINEESLLEKLDTSLKLNPSLSNPGWLKKLKVLKLLKQNYKKALDIDGAKKVQDKILNHAESASKINDKSLVAIELELQVRIDEEDFDGTKEIIEKLYALYKKTDVKMQIDVDELLNEAVSSFYFYKKKVNANDLTNFFFEKHLKDNGIKCSSDLLLSKARYYIANNNQLTEARIYFDKALDCSNIIQCFQDAISLNNCFNKEYTEKLTEILENNRSKIIDRYYYEFKYELSICLEDYRHALEYLDKSYSAGLSSEAYYSDLSYLLILSEDYKKLISLATVHAEKLKNMDCKAFTINFQYALHKTGNKKYEPDVLRNIIANTKEPHLLIAANSVLELDKHVKRELSKQIDISFLNYYSYKRWPIIPKQIFDSFDTEKAA